MVFWISVVKFLIKFWFKRVPFRCTYLSDSLGVRLNEGEPTTYQVVRYYVPGVNFWHFEHTLALVFACLCCIRIFFLED